MTHVNKPGLHLGAPPPAAGAAAATCCVYLEPSPAAAAAPIWLCPGIAAGAKSLWEDEITAVTEIGSRQRGGEEGGGEPSLLKYFNPSVSLACGAAADAVGKTQERKPHVHQLPVGRSADPQQLSQR